MSLLRNSRDSFKTNSQRLIHVQRETDKQLSKIIERASQDPHLPKPNPTVSFWQEPPFQNPAAQPLPESTDVFIVGSGITAASTAYHLLASDPTIRVAIAEARNLCSGATGRNGGHILELPYEDYEMQVQMLGRDATKKLVQFRLDHLDALLSFANDALDQNARNHCQIRQVTAVDAFFDQQSWESTKAELGVFLQDFPEQRKLWQVWEGDEARQEFAMPNIYGAITGPAGAIWPYRFVGSVYKLLATEFGSRFSTTANAAVLEVSRSNIPAEHALKIRTSRGTSYSKNVVYCTNGHTSHLLPRLRGKIWPLRGQMTTQTIQSSPLPNSGASRSWLLRYARGYDYMTQDPSTGDYYLGGGLLNGEDRGAVDVGNVADDEQSGLALAHLRGTLPLVFEDQGVFRRGGNDDDDGRKAPGVVNPVTKTAWSGVMGFSSDGKPWVGRLPKCITGREVDGKGGEWIAAGFCGEGMVQCWLSGKGLAEMMLGGGAEWFPEVLLPSEKRFRTCNVEDFALYWASI